MSIRAAISLLIISLSLFACGDQGKVQLTPTIPEIEPDLQARQLQILEEIDQIIREGYLFEDHGGFDWDGGVEELRTLTNHDLSQEQFTAALETLIVRLPEGTVFYMTREEGVAAEIENTTIYTGIGTFVSFRAEPEPRVILLSVIEGSPAQSAGLRSHDAIYTIDGEHVRVEEGLTVVDRIRGPEGTDVVLEVASPGELRREVIVTRGRLAAIDRFYTGKFPSGVSYILSPVMSDRTLSDAILEDLEDLEAQAQAPGVILDLRIAHATAEWPLVALLSLFSDGNHGSLYSREGQTPLTVEGQDFFNSQSVPLVILIGPDTNGPSEVFAAALQANGRATLVGLPTPGQVLGFEVRRLSDGSQLTYAASSFITSDGQDLAWSGVSPDVLVGDDWDQVNAEFDPVIETAEQLLLSTED